MPNVTIHPRVFAKRPWLNSEDILRAVQFPRARNPRDGVPLIIAGIGYDLAMREIE